MTIPCGAGTWKNGNFTWRNSAPILIACEPLLMATFWTKSQTLLYSSVGPHWAPPKPVYPLAREARKAAVGRIGGGRIVPADAKLLEQIRVRIGADARRHQAGEAGAGFRDHRRLPDARVADLPVAAEVDFAGAAEAAVVESARERRHAGLVRIPPAHRAKQAVFVAEPVVHARVALIGQLRPGVL